MAVLGPLSVTLEVPSLEEGVKFYTDAGLIASVVGNVARFKCVGQKKWPRLSEQKPCFDKWISAVG